MVDATTDAKASALLNSLVPLDTNSGGTAVSVDRNEATNPLYKDIVAPADIEKRPITTIVGTQDDQKIVNIAYTDFKRAYLKWWEMQTHTDEFLSKYPSPEPSMNEFLLYDIGEYPNGAIDGIGGFGEERFTNQVLPGTGQLDIIINRISRELSSLVKDLSMDNPQRGIILAQAIPAAINAAIHYGLSEATSYWDSVTAQMRARKAEIEATISLNEVEKSENQKQLVRVQLATGKMEMLTAEQNYLASIEQVETAKYNKEAARAQIYNDLSGNDGGAIAGTIGRNNKVLDEQANAFKGDQLNKLATLFVNTYAVEKSNGEATVPTLLGESTTNAVMKALINQTTGGTLYKIKVKTEGSLEYKIFTKEEITANGAEVQLYSPA